MRAPWRWRWRRIWGLVALWSGAIAVCRYAPILWLAVAGWITCWLHVTPLPHRDPAPLLDEEAGQSTGTTSKSKFGGAQITVIDHSERHSYRTGLRLDPGRQIPEVEDEG